MIVFLIYIILILVITYLNRSEVLKGVFKSTKKTTWVVPSISLLMYYISIEQGQMITGILTNQGLWGLWLFWSGLLGVAFTPIIFAPLWSKLDFVTDNQFLLFRYSGLSSKILHIFRAFYVGGIVVAFLLSFHILAFSRVVEIYFHLNRYSSIVLTGGVLLIFSIKNTFQIKLKIDVLHIFIYLLLLSIAFYYLYQASGGFKESFTKYGKAGVDNLNLFPPVEQKSAWVSWFAFVGVQWWSAQLFDGGGPEMARFTAVKGKRNAILTALIPVVLYIVLSFLMVSLSVMVLSTSTSNLGESQFISSIYSVVPESLRMLCFLGFFGMFITISESQMNWGGSFLTIDLYQKYIQPERSEKHYMFISFLVMFSLSLLGIVIAFNFDSLQGLLKFVFSISAGVAPVFILRWFWLRINAWSQLSAMLSSAIYTMLFSFFFNKNIFFVNYFEEARLIAVTILTSATWIIVTFLTKKDDEDVLMRFKKIVPDKKTVLREFRIAFAIGLFFLLLVLSVWKLIIFFL